MEGRHHLPDGRRRERYDGQLHPEQLHGFGSGCELDLSHQPAKPLAVRSAWTPVQPTRSTWWRAGKRPFHTIIPAFLTKDGQPVMSYGDGRQHAARNTCRRWCACSTTARTAGRHAPPTLALQRQAEINVEQQWTGCRAWPSHRPDGSHRRPSQDQPPASSSGVPATGRGAILPPATTGWPPAS